MQRGFTLIEVLLSVAIISILVGIAMPVYSGFAQRNELDTTTQTLGQALRRAETYARSGKSDGPWGVAVSTSTFTVFQGATYASRNTALDEAVTVPGSITLAGTSEIIFARLSGIPASTASITLNSNTNTTRGVSVNAKGMVSY